MSINVMKKLFLQLEELDMQIKLINNYVFLIKDKSLEINFSLSHPKEKEPKNILNFEYQPIFFSFGNSKEESEILNLKINEIMSLEVLGVIAAHLEGQRMFIINSLKKKGLKNLK